MLNGGTGSNFLTGGTGPDTFFVDARNAQSPIWSTLVGFGTGDAATLWGINETIFDLKWFDGQGTPGYTGLTLEATVKGQPLPIANLTLSGYTKAALGNGTLAIKFENDPISGSNFMKIDHL